MKKSTYRALGIAAVALVAVAGLAVVATGEKGGSASDPASDEVRQLAKQYMGYYKTIELTPEQEAVKKEALEALPAACCSDNTAYTCCCPCNLSKTIWGLSNHLIAEQGANAEEVKKAVQEWTARINPDGYSGDVCYTRGGCGRAFAENGCGGMHESQLTWGE